MKLKKWKTNNNHHVLIINKPEEDTTTEIFFSYESPVAQLEYKGDSSYGKLVKLYPHYDYSRTTSKYLKEYLTLKCFDFLCVPLDDYKRVLDQIWEEGKESEKA